MGVDAELTVDMMRVQLRWLEREMTTLRRLIDQAKVPQIVESFDMLEGVWQGIIFSEKDLESSRLTIPEDF